jgi:hypothetical protein
MAKEKENAPQQKGPQQKGQQGGQPQQQQQKKQQQAKGAPAPKPAKDEAPAVPPPPPRLREHYRTQVVPDLMKKFGYKTVMEVPRVSKITLNMGVGETTTDKKILDNAVADMTRIAGQKPVVTKARKSIANFKVRAGFPVEIQGAAADAARAAAKPARLGRGQGSGARKAAEAAARRLTGAAAQPLRAHRAATRRVSQVRPGPDQAARARDARRSAGRHQGELVRRPAWG